MILPNIFLEELEEKSIKSEFQKYYDSGDLDDDISGHLLKLNTISGLTTLYSCQGHKETGGTPYLVLKCSEEMYNPLSEALYSLKNINIEWNQTVQYKVLGKETRLKVIIVRSESNTFFKKLVTLLAD